MKKHVKKKIITAMMAVVMVMMQFTVPAMAEDTFDTTAHGDVSETGQCGRSIDYTLYEDGTLYISGKGKMNNYNYFDTKSPFSDNYNILSVVIEDGITHIGSDTFYECQNLSEITVPKSITSVGELAFDGTAWLQNQIKNHSLIIINNMVIDGKSCTGVVNIPQGITKIAQHAFEDNKNITSVTVPEGVLNIEESAFCACSNLMSVTLPDSLDKLGKYAFSECKNLINIKMPETLSEMGEGAFSDCYALKSIRIPSGLSTISSYAFWMCDSLKHVTIPEGTTTIASYAFANCMRLQTVTIEKAVTIVKEYAFTCCDSLTAVAIPGSVRKIEDTVFLDCLSRFTIYGESGSVAETFANAHNIPFSTEAMPEQKEEEIQNLPGDVNGDGTVQLNDAQLALQASLKIIQLDTAMKDRADVDKDQEITLSDAQRILRIALKIEK